MISKRPCLLELMKNVFYGLQRGKSICLFKFKLLSSIYIFLLLVYKYQNLFGSLNAPLSHLIKIGFKKHYQ